MIALRLVRLIERHADNLAEELIEKLRASARTSDMQKVPEAELRSRIHEILEHLGEWWLTKTGSDVEIRYRDLGARRAAQGGRLPRRFLLGHRADQRTSLGISAAARIPT